MLLAGCRPEHQAVISGIERLALDGNDAIVVTDRSDGPGASLFLIGPNGQPAPQVRIAIGEIFQLADGRHATDTYTLLRIEGGQVVLEHKSVFNAKSIDGSIKSTTSVIIVPPYTASPPDKGPAKTPD